MSADLLVSVIIPTYERPDALARCVQALAAQTLDASDYEILLVDDGSSRPPRIDLPRNARLLRQANAGPATARNRGAAEARGRLLAFTDDDCLPDPDWLLHLTQALHDQPGALVGGVTLNALTDNVFSQASQDVVTFLQRRGEAAGSPFVASNNIALSAQSFRALGGFDTRYRGAGGEDRALCREWHAQGRPLATVPGAIVRHHHALDLKGFWRQHAAYGRGAYRFHRGAESRSDLLGRAAFYSGLLSAPLRMPNRKKAFRRSALLALAQVATAWGYARESAPGGSRSRVTR